MPRKLHAVLFVLVALLALPAAASAKPKVGISENNPQMFADPNFQALGVKYTRLVMSWNAFDAQRNGDNEITVRIEPYLYAARAAGIDVLIAIEHARGAAEVCKTRRTLPQCRLPSDADYEQNIRELFAKFPWVKTIAPWNEANHFTQPTSRNPKAAARFTKVVERVCPTCDVITVDVLDQADSAKAKKPTFKSTTRWIKTFKKAYGKKPKLCGIHNYSDTNRFRDTGTRTLIKQLKCRKYWLTETGGIAKFGSFKFDLKRQLKATKFMFKTANKIKSILRVYVYTFYGGITPRFDAGLVEVRSDGSSEPRPAYNEVKRQT